MTEGRERARANGVHMGRPPKLTPRQRKEAIKRRDGGEPTREIVRMLNVPHRRFRGLRHDRIAKSPRLSDHHLDLTKFFVIMPI